MQASVGADPWDVLFGRWSVAVGVAVVLGTALGGYGIEPGALRLELCWFHAGSGLPCPGCGLTRSLLALARGQPGQSMLFHPFVQRKTKPD